MHTDTGTTWPDLRANLKAAILFALLRKRAVDYCVPSLTQCAALLLLSLLFTVASQVAMVGLQGEIYPDALPSLLFPAACLLLTAWVATRAAGNESQILQAMTALAAVHLVTNIAITGIGLVPYTIWELLGENVSGLLFNLPLCWQALASIVAVNRLCAVPAEKRVGTILAVFYLLLIPMYVVSYNDYLWIPHYEKSAEDDRSRWDKARSETMLYQQHQLLGQQLAHIQPGNPKMPQLYLLSIAGYGSQDVFMREALQVKQLFDERFATADTSIVLVNNPATVEQYSLATVTAIQQALLEIGRKMNREQDILFLFMTSHGAQDYEFSLSLWPYRMNEMTPEVLLKALDEAGIKNRIIVVSACYSGGFVPKLANDDTLVMSASRHDRNSHGCSHEAEWTFFGKAYFDEALRETHDFEQAFQTATAAIHEREETEKRKHSEPQIAIGARIKPLLESWRQAQAPAPVTVDPRTH